MSIFKCKICGGALEIDNAQSVATCEYCGTKQTLPRLDDERRANLYDRANHFRRNNDFDKAMGIFEQILNEEPTDAEAYWSLVLCRYGIEYVEDPATRRRVPTVNRAQFTSIFDDEDYKSAIANADGYQREIYEAEATAINEIQKGILAISQKEEPFDVFICYKETDNNGRRTQDSVLATELYHELTREGFKVFFSRITLEDKLGQEYEPYIFAALNSARVMVVLGTKPEHFNAVWVKNEWSRYLALIKNGAKKTLIPAYRDMDPYDLPEEFSHLQAQDMSKLGFMQDLTRGIKKIIGAESPKPTRPVVAATTQSDYENTAQDNEALLTRAFLFLEDGDFKSANEYCERVLDKDPKNAQAYLGKLMIDTTSRKQEDLVVCGAKIEENGNFQKAIRFGDQNLKDILKDYVLQAKYNSAQTCMKLAKTEEDYKKAASLFGIIPNYMDAAFLQKKCIEKAEAARLAALYYEGECLLRAKKYLEAANVFARIPGYKDSDAKVAACHEKETEERKSERYKEAQKAALKNSSAEMKQAANLFASIAGWRDADQKAQECLVKAKELKKQELRRARRIKIALLSICCLLVITGISVALYQALIVNVKQDGVRYKKDGDAYVVVGVDGQVEDIVISSEIKNKPVVSIVDAAFENCTTLKSVVIPESVTSIGFGAFKGCNSLESITLPFVGATLNGEKDDHFGYIFGADSSSYNKPYVPISLSTVVITGGTSIGYAAFYECGSLTSITIAESVTSIGNLAFKECNSLMSVTIPENVTSIGEYAFENCTSLTGVYITDLAAWCKISFNNMWSNPLYYAHDLYLNGTLLTNLVIPEGVTDVGDYAFYNCTGLTSITIPSSVTSIRESAFMYCTGLTGVYITDLAAWCKILFSPNFANPLYYARDLYLNSILVTDLVIPEGVTDIGDSAFAFCSSLTSVTIPKSVTSIGLLAFSQCSSLASVTIPEGMTVIGNFAFLGCSALRSVTILESVTHIGDYAFLGCSLLTSITIPESVTSIGYAAFDRCSLLSSVTIENTNGWYLDDGISISATDLADPATAATYLTTTYCRYDWQR